MKLMEDISNFCRRRATRESSLYKLYWDFKLIHPVSQEDFELGMLNLNKKAAKDLKKKCIDFAKENGPDSYHMFIKILGPVTKKFWDHCVLEKQIFHAPEKQQSSAEYEKLLPIDWPRMDLPSRIEFVKKIQHDAFRKYVLSTDAALDKYFKAKKYTSNKISLYVTIFSVPADNYSEEAKNLLRTFTEVLNMTGRAKLQYVECNSPNVIEIREVR